jgi:hypothetical protein
MLIPVTGDDEAGGSLIVVIGRSREAPVICGVWVAEGDVLLVR